MTEEQLKEIERNSRCLNEDWTVDVGADRARLAANVPDLIAEIRRLRALLGVREITRITEDAGGYDKEFK